MKKRMLLLSVHIYIRSCDQMYRQYCVYCVPNLKFRVGLACTSGNCKSVSKKVCPFFCLSVTMSQMGFIITTAHSYVKQLQFAQKKKKRKNRQINVWVTNPSMSLEQTDESASHEYSVDSEMTENRNKQSDVALRWFWTLKTESARSLLFPMSCLIYLLILSLYSFDLVVCTPFIMW